MVISSITRDPRPVRELLVGGLRVGVVGAEHPELIGEQQFECGCGAGRVTGFALPGGEVEASGQGIGVVGSLYPQSICDPLCGPGPPEPALPHPSAASEAWPLS